MPSPEYDLRYLRAGLPLLEDYLLSSEVYWPIGVNPPAGETPYPSLTLGGLMLAQKRLHARDLSSEHASDLASLDEQLDSVRARWRVAWGKKASAEFHARLLLWRDFVEDYRGNKEGNADRYAYEVSRRVMLHLLRPDADNVPEVELDLLKGLDSLIQAFFVPGSFIWDQELSPGFSREDYWYLYGHLREK